MPLKTSCQTIRPINSTHATQWFGWSLVTFLVILFLLVVIPYTTANWDPYEVLGIRRDASGEQIKRAYRELAKKLHPDKSHVDDDDGGRRFIELNKAFDILKDPSRRRRYDQSGDIGEINRHSKVNPGEGYHRATRESWSVHNGFRTYTYFSSSHDSYYRRNSITAKQYYDLYIRESKQRPFLIFFYADICPTCSMIESTWVKLTEELAKYNIGSFAINVHRESRLIRDLGVHTIPHVACLLDTQLHPYHQSEISLPSFVRFIKNALPNNLVPILRTASEQGRHIATGPQLNRLSAIVVGNEKTLKLRYLLMAFATRQYYRFGFVSTKLSEHSTLFKQYNLKPDSGPIILIFDERSVTPVMKFELHPDNFNTTHYINQLLVWPFLRLPKLSSQQRFDDLCLYARPRGVDRISPSLCVILFARSTPSSQANRDKMIEFIELNQLGRDSRVAFVYVDPDKQTSFVETLIEETKSNQPTFIRESIHSSIILIERHPTDNRKAKYEWLSTRWNSKHPDEIDRAKLELHRMILGYKQEYFVPKQKVVLSLLVDEEGPGLLERLYTRFVDSIKRLASYLASRESFSAMMILIACGLLTSLFLYKSPVPVHFSAQDINGHNRYARSSSGTNSSFKTSVPSSRTSSSSEAHLSTDGDLKIIELRAETYNGMVRLLKPGYRSIVLLTDQASKDKLLANFRKAVWPYRRNKTLLFGLLCLDKNLSWYKTLLERILGCENLNVNKKNCIGTVLSLNGFKKYLRVYHAKHHEIDYYDDQTDNDGSFLGFDDRCDDTEAHRSALRPAEGESNGSHQEIIYNEDNLLERLPIWLDKMFDGLTKRYFLDQWPVEIK